MLKDNFKGEQIAAQTAPQERRRDVRHQFTAAVEAVDIASQTRIQGRISDLSRCGCYVDTMSSFPAGSLLKMRLTKDLRTFDLEAEVVYSTSSMGMGLRFVGNTFEQKQTVDTWIAELSGEAPAESEFIRSVEQHPAKATSSSNESQVLAELLTELMRLSVLPSAKCEAMLRKLNRATGGNSSVARA